MEKILLDVVEGAGVAFAMNGIEAPGVSAMRSPLVASTALTLAARSMEAASPGSMIRAGGLESPRLMAVLMDYAIEIAPRAPGQENVIDVAAMETFNGQLAELSEPIEFPSDFIKSIGQHAQMRINLAQLAPEATAPERNEGAGS